MRPSPGFNLHNPNTNTSNLYVEGKDRKAANTIGLMRLARMNAPNCLGTKNTEQIRT